MPRRLTVLAALMLAIVAVAAVACGDDDDSDDASPAASPSITSTAAASDAAFPLTIEGSDGEALTLDAAPTRVITLSAHATQIACTIDAGDSLIAVEQYANCPAGGDDKPALDAYQPNVEAIVGYEPDLVLVSNDVDGLVEALRRTGTPVLFLDLPADIDGIYGQIEMFGQITGHDDEAAAVIDDMRTRISAVEDEVSDVAEVPRIYHELDPLFYTAAPESFIGDLYTILRAENIAAGAVEEYPQLTAEVIIERDPEVIILADEDSGVTPESIGARPGWSGISAVREGRICVIDPDVVSQPAPNIVDGLEQLAECLYPDRF